MEFEEGMTMFYGGSLSGKTTLCLILSGLAPEYTGGAIRGRIESDNRSIILFQDVENQIIGRTPLEDLSLSSDDPWHYLRKFRLEHLAERDVNTLSGGEMKRLALASLFSQTEDEDVDIIADEPYSGLDPRSKEEVDKMLKNLAKKHCVILSERYTLKDGLLLKDGSLIEAEVEEMLREGVKVENWTEKLGITKRGVKDGSILLKIRDLSFGYDDILLDGVSLDIYSGEIIALTGPNGSGKSTLARLMCGIEKPLEGSIEGKGVMMFQNPSLNLTSAESLHPELRDALCIRERNLFRMSRREKMKAGIAKVMGMKSPLKIIDEVDGLLDANELKILLNIMKKECNSGASFVIVTHDPWLKNICDREFRICDGEVEVIENYRD